MPNPVASAVLTVDDLLRAAAPQLKTQYPLLALTSHWRMNIAQLPDGGIRVDVLGPASQGDRQ